jgi:hypothetical protein
MAREKHLGHGSSPEAAQSIRCALLGGSRQGQNDAFAQGRLGSRAFDLRRVKAIPRYLDDKVFRRTIAEQTIHHPCRLPRFTTKCCTPASAAAIFSLKLTELAVQYLSNDPEPKYKMHTQLLETYILHHPSHSWLAMYSRHGCNNFFG